MSNDLKSVIIVLLASGVVYGLLWFSGTKRKEVLPHMFMWMAVTAAVFLTHSMYILVAAVVFFKFTYLGNKVDKNLYAFLFLLPAIHLELETLFPTAGFPLLVLDFYRLLVIVFLIPLLPAVWRMNNERPRSGNIILDLPFIFFIVMAVILAFSPQEKYDVTTINSIKLTLYLITDLIIPYYIISSWIRTDARLLKAFKAIIVGGMVLVVVGVVNAIIGWDIYNNMELDGMIEMGGYISNRSGYIRVKSTMGNPIVYGFYLTIILAFVMGIIATKNLSKWKSATFILPILLALYFTNSKGAQLGAAAILISFFYFKLPSRSKRVTIVFLLTLMLGAFSFLFFKVDFNVDSVEQADEHGSFEYRKRLFYAYLDVIPHAPWFGDPEYTKNPVMEDMRQGEGIIDPVNSYLHIAASRGILTLILFVYLILRGLRGVLSYIDSGYIYRKRFRVLMGAAVAAAIAGMMIQILLSSFAGGVKVYFWMLMAIARGISLGMENKGKQSTQDYQYQFEGDGEGDNSFRKS